MRQPARRTRKRKSKTLTHADCDGDDDIITSSQEISIFYVELKISIYEFVKVYEIEKKFWSQEGIPFRKNLLERVSLI